MRRLSLRTIVVDFHSGGSLKNLVLFHQIFPLLNRRRLFPFPFAEGISSFGFWQLCAILFPVIDGTTSIAWRHLLQLIDGFSCAPARPLPFG